MSNGHDFQDIIDLGILNYSDIIPVEKHNVNCWRNALNLSERLEMEALHIRQIFKKYELDESVAHTILEHLKASRILLENMAQEIEPDVEELSEFLFVESEQAPKTLVE